MFMFDPSSPFLTQPDPLAPGQKAGFAEDRLKTAVLLCELGPGDVATEGEIALRFGIGRAAARVALARLSALGLVHPIPRLGWKILPMSGALIGQVIDARRLGEPGLAQAVLNQKDTDRLHELATVVEILGQSDDAGARASRLGYERAFLEVVAGRMNPLIANFLRSLWDHSGRILRYLEQPDSDDLPAMDAIALADALTAGDCERVSVLCMTALDTFETFAAAALLRDQTELGRKTILQHPAEKTGLNRQGAQSFGDVEKTRDGALATDRRNKT